MEISEKEFERLIDFMEKEQEKARRIEGRNTLREARVSYAAIGELIDRIQLIPRGKAAAVDQPFAETNTFLPSTLIRTQLRLASHYIQAADESGTPTLSSFVVLRAAVECTATAHWLMSGGNHRENVERVLKRMWWDTQSAADMATAADSNPDLSGLSDLREKIASITRPIKRLDEEMITGSTRVRLSGIVENASRALRPDDPTAMYATWMVCAAVSHGNIPVSAGAGLEAALVQQPAEHPIDESVYAQLLSVVVADLATTAKLFERHAAEQHTHQS